MRLSAIALLLVLLSIHAQARAACSDWPALRERSIPFGTVADMDRDGWLDIVSFGVGITIHYGPDFTRAHVLRDGITHSAITVADFDRDNRPDIAAGQATGDGGVVVLFNRGAGFEEREVGSMRPRILQAADVTGDGAPDLVAIAVNKDLMMALNDGHGTFKPPQQTGVRADFMLATGDLDGDGKSDLVIRAWDRGDIAPIYLSDGRGGLELVSTDRRTGLVTALAIADLDGDGRALVYVALPGGVAGIPTKGITRQIVAADVDRNGGLDLILREDRVIEVWLSENRAARTFRRAADVPAPADTRSIAAADFDRDGITDLLIDLGASGTRLLLGRGDGTFAPYRMDLGFDAKLAATGDIDGDGDTDVIGSTSSSLTLYRNESGTLVPQPLSATGNASGLAVADLDGDGRVEIAASTPGDGKRGVSILQGGGEPRVAASFDTTSGTLAIGDFDGDGRKELAFAATVDKGQIVSWDGSQWRVSSEFALPRDSSPSAAADFDGDGRDDLVLLRSQSSFFGNPEHDGMVAVLFSQANGAFAEPLTIYAPPASPHATLVGDFDGDGRPDVAIDTGELLIAYSSGRTFDVRRIDNPSGEVKTRLGVAADLDLDGRDELVVIGATNIETLYLGDRGRPLRRVVITPAFVQGAIAVADLTGNGNFDLFTFSELLLAHCNSLPRRRPR